MSFWNGIRLPRPRRKLLIALVCLCGLLAATAQQPPQAAAPGEGADYHMNQAEAQQLFRSLDDILQFASLSSGLPIRHPVKKKLATREEVSKYLEKRLKEQGNGERFDRSSRSLKKLGLLPRDFNLREYMLALYKEQVEGWYDAHSKTVYLLDWVEPELQKPVMAHELTHALQDQNYDLEKWLQGTKDSKDDTEQMIIDEQRAARQAVIEGQAMLVLFDYELAPLGKSVETAPTLVDSMRDAMTADEQGSVYGKAPIYLREATLFSYTYGTDFVRTVLTKRGKQAAFAGVLERPPLDTHQVMQPAAYLANEPLTRIKVVPLEQVLGADWTREDFSGLGEIDLRVILRQWGGRDVAAKLTPSWHGGYYMALSNKSASNKALSNNKNAPESSANQAPLPPLALVLNFTTAEAAHDFVALYRTALPQRYKSVELKSPDVWLTEEGEARLYVEGQTVIALESFSAEEAAKLHAALVGAVAKPLAASAN